MFVKFGSKVYINSGRHKGRYGKVINRFHKDIYQVEVFWKILGIFPRSVVAMLKQTELNQM